MQISVIGVLVCAVIWIVGRTLGSSLVIGLIVSIAFGTTSVVTLSALGGSSPLIYLVFSLMLVGLVALDRDLAQTLKAAFTADWVTWLICGSIVYAVAGAYIMPRLFAGVTSAFVTARDSGVIEVALSPNPGNITQTGYYALGGITCIMLLGLLIRQNALEAVRTGLYFWAGITASCGAIDLLAKMAGAGDVFLPIRTATFALLTSDEQGGFWRINGLYSEASGFASGALAALAFTFTMWKWGGSRYALLLTVLLIALLLLSTSSTAYAGLIVLLLALVATLAMSWFTGRVARDSIAVALCAAVLAAIVLAILIANARLLDPIQHLFQTTVLDKSQSESARERGHWNVRSLASLYDTWGLGVGFGSSRASNWLVATLSQLGLIGTGLQLGLLVPFLRRPPMPSLASSAYDIYVLHNGLKACAWSSLVGSVISGGSADPGLLLFVALAGVIACQVELARHAALQTGRSGPAPRSPRARASGRLAVVHGPAAPSEPGLPARPR